MWVTHINGACNVKKFLGPHPWDPKEGPKDQISFNFNYKVIFKDFYSKLCVCSHKWKIQNISDGFFILSPGSCPKGGTWGYLGQNQFGPAVCPLSCLLLNHWTKFNQIWCVSYSHEWGGQRKKIFGPIPWGPGEGSKGQISILNINFNYKVNFQRFLFQTLIVFSQMKDTKHIRRDFYSVAWDMPQGWDFGALGVPRGSIFFQTWSCGISNRRGWRAE